MTPVTDHLVDLYLSSFRLSKKNDEATLLAYTALKQSLSERRFSAELMMDVQDKSSGAEAAALMYVSSLSIKKMDQALRRMLKNFGWSVIEDSQRHQSVFKASSIDAVRPGAALRINLMGDVGRTFLYINLTGGIQP
jgi:predicted transcriptional regulator